MKRRTNDLPRPVLKWAGGKTSLLSEYNSKGLFPKKFDRYFEPFIGGAAVFFHLWRTGSVNEAKLSDVNSEIVNLYSVIKRNVQELIAELSLDEYRNEKDNFYARRERFNTLKTESVEDETLATRVERAAHLIYLNKTCFNGLYRENKSGGFNVPFGRYKRPTILDRENLLAVSKAFASCEIVQSDFRDSVSEAAEGDFVYMDPPYVPLTDTAAFTDYHMNGFDYGDQERLADLFRDLTEKGVLALLSNSSHPSVWELYQDIPGVQIVEVMAPRFINCKGDGRGAVTELAIVNFDPAPENRTLSSYF